MPLKFFHSLCTSALFPAKPVFHLATKPFQFYRCIEDLFASTFAAIIQIIIAAVCFFAANLLLVFAFKYHFCRTFS